MSDTYAFRVRLGDGQSWVVTSDHEDFDLAVAEAEAKRERSFPFDSEARIEAWTHSDGYWHDLPLAHRCARCAGRDVMPSLGNACSTSCGGC